VSGQVHVCKEYQVTLDTPNTHVLDRSLDTPNTHVLDRSLDIPNTHVLDAHSILLTHMYLSTRVLGVSSERSSTCV
jgi:hypothetical protein